MLDGTLPQIEVAQPVLHERGEIGIATPSLIIKQLWHKEWFTISNKKDLLRKKGCPSLKQFARQLVKLDKSEAKEWLANKNGKLNQERSDKNKGRISSERQATRSSRKKNVSGKATKSEAVSK
jgi:hypothetical protein